MNNKLAEQMEAAWMYITRKLFCKKTNLFYDYLSNLEHARRFEHLPKLDEINNQFPNPCGWGTGMEDSMLNAGSAIDILRLRQKLSGDPDALPFAIRVLEGMDTCSHVHGEPGFVVRSVSPHDGCSCYINSSRDQFTLCVYGAWRFLRSFPEAEQNAQEKAKRILINIASYCEKTIIPENAFNLLRLDGKQALVSSMWGKIGIHEVMRLPMFYAAAYDASGDEHWFDLYRQYAVPGIEINLRPDPYHSWWDIELSQMQISLAVISEIEKDSSLLKKYREAMKITSALTEKHFRETIAESRIYNGDWSSINNNWRCREMYMREEAFGDSSLFEGYPYLMPRPNKAYRQPSSILRAIGNDLYTVLLTPGYTLPDDLAEGFLEVALKPDYHTHTFGAPINLLHGFWTAQNCGITFDKKKDV